MSSKVAIERRTDAARPFAWRTVALSGETLDRRRTAPESKSASPDSHHPLERRVAELEQMIETRVHEAREAGLREGEAAAQAQAVALSRPELRVAALRATRRLSSRSARSRTSPHPRAT